MLRRGRGPRLSTFQLIGTETLNRVFCAFVSRTADQAWPYDYWSYQLLIIGMNDRIARPVQLGLCHPK